MGGIFRLSFFIANFFFPFCHFYDRMEAIFKNERGVGIMKPLIAIPMGDAAGIGPEIVVKALSSPQVQKAAYCLVVGDGAVMEQAVALCGVPLDIRSVKEAAEAKNDAPGIYLLDLSNIDQDKFQKGQVQAMCGQAAFEAIEKAVSLAMTGEVDAVATTPIHKEALRAAGVPFIGHTEIFGALTNTKDPLTMFEVRGLRVFFLSRHVSLSQACKMVTKERVMDYVVRCKEALAALGVTEGTMAVAGLNPHSGEHGLFGMEEVEAVTPAVEALQKQGINVVGPIGADSVFHLALKGRYNSVLSLYHDQGHIATKTLDFERTISITCGMPILRTSVDHGTAMDIAWKNEASAISMEEAILLAAKYAPYFQK